MPRDLTSGAEPPYTVLQPLDATYTDPKKRLRTAFRHVNKPRSVHMHLYVHFKRLSVWAHIWEMFVTKKTGKLLMWPIWEIQTAQTDARNHLNIIRKLFKSFNYWTVLRLILQRFGASSEKNSFSLYSQIIEFQGLNFHGSRQKPHRYLWFRTVW